MIIAKTFEFTNYSIDYQTGRITFLYTVYFKNGENKVYEEVLVLPQRIKRKNENAELVEKLLQAVHIALGVSYFKLHIPKNITLPKYDIDKNQSDFWNTVYTKGLGQFYYSNKIDFQNLVSFPYSKKVSTISKKIPLNQKKVLLPFGGGKDSLLSFYLMQLLSGYSTDAIIVKNNKTITDIADAHNIPNSVIERNIDPSLLLQKKENKKNNDHVPITLMISFISLLYAALYDYGVVVFSNEKSSDFGNTMYLGLDINHQWSKTAECEKLIQNYIKNTFKDSITNFSLFRNIYEIEIVRRFVEKGLYKKPFTSCNKNFTVIDKKNTQLWCGNCPKCASTFLLFSAFLSKSELIHLFGSNFFNNKNLIQTFRDLLGIGDMKPFDCVGTELETEIAFYKTFLRGEFKNTYAMTIFEKDVLPKLKNIEENEKKVFVNNTFDGIPQPFNSLIV